MRLTDIDTVYRQDAVEALKNAEPLVRAFGYYNAIEAIRLLPSAESEPDPEWRKKHYEMAYNQGYVDACKYYENLPERKKGKWIKIPEFCGDDVSGFVDNHFSCSECKKEAEINPWGFYILSDFCPNCGADMRGE